MNPFPTVDFETAGIVGNPVLSPPEPCGVSIKWPGHPSNYFAWGHPAENNCSRYNASQALAQVLRSGAPIVFHNAPFDLSVWASMPEFAAGIAELLKQPLRIHDTLYLIFFHDPYARTFSLKPSAHRILGMPPEEQTELKNWILSHVCEATSDDWGAYICRAPGSLVGKYANGDTIRTDLLFEKLYGQIEAQGMLSAYQREQILMPTLVDATRRGVRVDRERLCEDEQLYTKSLARCEARLCEKIGVTPEQLEEDEEALKDGLERCGAVKEWVLTPKSKQRSMAEGNLKIEIPDIRDLLDYRGALKTSLQTFMRPWILMSPDGRLHPNWNQVRQAKGDWGSKGARTGRMSSDSPNFQNLPTDWEYKDGTPMNVPMGLLPYPTLRSYVLPEVGHVWLKRDFSSQEIRILAHFEDGALCQAYRQDASMDPHKMAQSLIKELSGLVFSRRPVKITGFSIIYGTGYPGLAAQLGQPIEVARQLKDAYLAAMPDVKALMSDVKVRGRIGQGVRTWGGRIYLVEPPTNGRTYEYKLLNYLIQGSAADQTKDCINQWYSERSADTHLLAAVHDEINISAPKEEWERHMRHLRHVMEVDRFAVPFKTEGFVGPNWADIEACE